MRDPELIEHLERCLREAREAAAQAVDRAEALRELRGRAFAAAARLAPEGRVLDVEALLDAPERERAELHSLIARGFPKDA